ncbi:ferritin-like domain-containing protein [Acidovorax sp. NCPPB 4044]|uniref:ferritin-like domain-containing protein n=1 Tax=Acidovorax sp. NCPPB 4044 TaxID=2940490 RepID=UPI002303AE5B|nr:ferritin-like domain-containing protein [Acidovorax sp. NCPPB 4044]MDA8521343.1 ferritin-like domain-containing protein [Acidovorax sp. NCPPB 4044]
MEATTTGMNRTGASASPAGARAMAEAVERYSPPGPIDVSQSEEMRLLYAQEADPLGGVPPPTSLGGMVRTGVSKLMGDHPEILLDKIGERIAFERGGTRLYDALIVKYQAALNAGAQVPSPAEALQAAGLGTDDVALLADASALATLQRIRAEELQHFQLLSEAMRKLGGDPTAQTPCADVVATASMGLIQVVTDPRTTLAQALSAILTAELTDNAGWELLIQLAEQAGEADLVSEFAQALTEEQRHLSTVQAWLGALVVSGPLPNEAV